MIAVLVFLGAFVTTAAVLLALAWFLIVGAMLVRQARAAAKAWSPPSSVQL